MAQQSRLTLLLWRIYVRFRVPTSDSLPMPPALLPEDLMASSVTTLGESWPPSTSWPGSEEKRSPGSHNPLKDRNPHPHEPDYPLGPTSWQFYQAGDHALPQGPLQPLRCKCLVTCFCCCCWKMTCDQRLGRGEGPLTLVGMWHTQTQAGTHTYFFYSF